MPHPGARTGRRADAEQNTARILDAAAACLCRSPTASMAEIARAAGVGRVTVYGHFASREALIEATLARLLERGEAVLGGLDLTGDPRQALRTLIESSWRLIADADAALRSDLPATWLVSVLYHVLKGAAADVAGGRLDPSNAARFIAATVLAAYAPPDEP